MEELRLVAGALLTGLGALGGGVGIGTLTSKYIEAVARQPELQGQLFAQVLIALGLTAVSYTHLTLPTTHCV